MLEMDVDAVRRIVLDGLRGTGAQVYLFGSAARGEMRRTSDIDVAVLPERTLPAGLLGDISEALRESAVLCCVDLVDLSQTDESFRVQALQEAVHWTE